GGVHWLRLPEQKVDEENAHASPVGSQADIYVPRFGWVSDRIAYAEVLNRAQDEIKLYFIDAGSGRAKLMLDEKDDTWIDVNDDFVLVSDAASEPGQSSSTSSAFAPNGFLWGSWRDGFTHLYLYSFDAQDPLAQEAKLERQLTHGNFEVTSLDAVLGRTVYFTSNRSNDVERQLYSVGLSGGESKQLSRERGTHEAVFPGEAPADSGLFYADTFSTITSPPMLSLCKAGGDCQPVWQSRSVTGYNLPQPQFVDFKAEDGTVLHGVIILPPSDHASGSVPLLNYPYGGPHVQDVRDHWGGSRTIFSELLARQGIATLSADNRGMGGRGKKFTAALRRNFGEVELRDQLAVVDQALARFPQLDGNRMGWYGWSYGGYLTLYALTHSDRFRAGIAGAPVTDWRLYDSIYTERYMGLPQQNAAGYKKSSPVSTAADLHGDLLIVHGTGDDNVHFANTIQMVQALLDAGKQFDLMPLPGKTHASLGKVVEVDLYTRIRDHFMRTLMQAK
ncbi:MAG TPA: prolyl oligopeptidase family serine peptidase, partial [Terriglobales bacterium]|nr:prolyl oligopeptidase family serine peptidase [Terriglobales bacterium]